MSFKGYRCIRRGISLWTILERLFENYLRSVNPLQLNLCMSARQRREWRKWELDTLQVEVWWLVSSSWSRKRRNVLLPFLKSIYLKYLERPSLNFPDFAKPSRWENSHVVKDFKMFSSFCTISACVRIRSSCWSSSTRGFSLKDTKAW